MTASYVNQKRGNLPRTFKVETGDKVLKVKAETPADALRAVFEKAGEVKLTPVPVPEFTFEVVENGGIVHKGNIKWARKASSNEDDDS